MVPKLIALRKILATMSTQTHAVMTTTIIIMIIITIMKEDAAEEIMIILRNESLS